MGNMFKVVFVLQLVCNFLPAQQTNQSQWIFHLVWKLTVT